MSKIVVIMGAPGAGKGTQARLLQERLGLPQISTGDMFRAMKQAQTPLAEEVRAIMAAGTLVPDEVTIRVVEERTARDDCRGGYILDGFPRTPAQAEMLERLAAAQGHEIVAVLVDVPFDILEKRVTGRRTCPVCGEIYNVHFKPPQSDETSATSTPTRGSNSAPTTTPRRSRRASRPTSATRSRSSTTTSAPAASAALTARASRSRSTRTSKRS